MRGSLIISPTKSGWLADWLKILLKTMCLLFSSGNAGKRSRDNEQVSWRIGEKPQVKSLVFL